MYKHEAEACYGVRAYISTNLYKTDKNVIFFRAVTKDNGSPADMNELWVQNKLIVISMQANNDLFKHVLNCMP